MTDAELDALCRKLRSYYEGPKPKPIPPITDEAADAIAALRYDLDSYKTVIAAQRAKVANWKGRAERAERENAALRQAAQNLLALMDSVPIDPTLGDETDRVFSYLDFAELRATMLAKDKP